MRAWVPFVAALLLAPSCGPRPPPKFSQVQQQVFNPSCNFVACHKASSSEGGLNLEAGSAYTNLVGVTATGPQGTRKRVIASDVANSYLIEKFADKPDAGVRMPQGGDPLEAERLQLVKDWISNGAKND